MSGGSAMSSGRPLRAGVIGTGMIAQLTHLRYLAELPELYEVAAVCDIVPENARACAEQYGIGLVHTDWRKMLAEPLDAVFVLTSGSHAPMAIAAAEAGLHVFVEKPMCFSAGEGAEMVAAAEAAGVTLMVGYPKRNDPAYARFLAEAAETADARLLRVTTMESPFRPYVGHHPLRPSAPLPGDVVAQLTADADARVTAAIGPRRDLSRTVYQSVLIDTLVHELNAVRGILGEPDWLDFADLRETAVTVLFRFGAVRAAIHWLDLPGIARYQMEFALFAPERRVTLTFPSPYLRNEPAALVVEGGEAGTARSWRRDEVTSYEDAFRRELEEFRRCVASGTRPATSGADGLVDIALCQSIVECHRSGRPVSRPAAAR
jgi:predicted dehydrogenase